MPNKSDILINVLNLILKNYAGKLGIIWGCKGFDGDFEV